MKFHQLKLWDVYFKLLMSGDMDTQIRKNDRNYQPGDVCQFFEWSKERGRPTGNRSPYYRVCHVLYETPGLKHGYVQFTLDGPWGGRPRIRGIPNE